MVKPVALVPKEQEIKQECVELLEEVLAMARAGEISTVAIIFSSDDGYWGDRRSTTAKMAETVGRLEVIKQSWIKDYLEHN